MNEEIEPEKYLVALEQLQEFYAFLKGKVPEGWNIKKSKMPKLTPDQAFEVIYYLQEKMYLFKDSFEPCHEGKEIEPDNYPVTREQLQEFHEFLKGKVPEGWNIKKSKMPKLTPDQAFEVIYYLQEELQVFPDDFELCHACKQIFSRNDGGIIVDDNDGLEDAIERGYTVSKKDIGHIFCDECR